MDISNFNGLLPILREGEDGEGGGGTGTALATTTDTSLATTDTGSDDTALANTNDDSPQGDADTSRKVARHPGEELLRSNQDPEVKKFYNTVVRDRAFRKELGAMFPGVNPKAAVQSLVNDMVGLAGRHFNTPDPRDAAKRTGLQQVRDRLAEIEEIDLMFYGGNPQLLDGMTGDEEGRAAFAKLAPHMDNKWKEVAPNAWTAKTARQILADMTGAQLTNEKGQVVANADIPYRVQRLTMALQGDKDGNVTPMEMQMARNEVAAIAAYVQRITGLTSLAPEVFTPTKDAADSKLAERERKIAEREAQQRDDAFANDLSVMINRITQKTWDQLTKGVEVDARDKDDCIANFQRRYRIARNLKEPGADDKAVEYLQSDDRDGYLTHGVYLMNTYGVPTLKEEVKRMLAKMTPAKPGSRNTTTANTTANGNPVASTPAAGFFKLTAKPPTHVMDYPRMTPEMVKAKQAVLRVPFAGKPAGTKITW